MATIPTDITPDSSLNNKTYTPLEPSAFKFDQSVTGREETPEEMFHRTMVQAKTADPSITPDIVSSHLGNIAQDNLRLNANPTDPEAIDAGLTRDAEGSLSKNVALGWSQTWNNGVADFQDGLRALGVGVEADTFGRRARSQALEDAGPQGNSIFEKFGKDPWGTFGNLLGSGAEQAVTLVAPSVIINVLAPELGVGLAAKRFMDIARTGEKMVETGVKGVMAAEKVGSLSRTAYLTKALALKQLLNSPLTTAYVASTLSPYADAAYKASGGTMSYKEALGWGAIRSLGEAAIEGIGMGGRLAEQVNMEFLRRHQGAVTAAFIKRVSNGALKEGETKALESFGSRLLGRLSTPVASTGSFAVNYLESALNDPIQEAVQEFYGQIVNTMATGQSQLDSSAWADSFASMVPLSMLTGLFHASLNTRRQMAESAKKPMTTQEMQSIKASVDPKVWAELVDKPFNKFGDSILAQQKANAEKGIGALAKADPEVIVSTLNVLKGMAVKLWVVSNGKTTVDSIFGRLVPVLTNISDADMTALLNAVKEIQAVDSITDPAKKQAAHKKAMENFTIISEKSGISKQINDAADQMKIDTLKEVNDNAVKDGARDVSTPKTEAEAAEELKKTASLDGNTIEVEIDSALGSEFSSNLDKLADGDVNGLDVLLKSHIPEEIRRTIGTAGDLMANMDGNIKRIKAYLAWALKTKDVKTSESSGGVSIPLFITKDMRKKLAAMGYTDEQVSSMKPQEANDILNPPPANADGTPKASVKQTVKVGKPLTLDAFGRRFFEHLKPVLVNDDGSPDLNVIDRIAKLVIKYSQEMNLNRRDSLKRENIIRAVEKSGEKDLIDMMPTKRLNRSDLDNIVNHTLDIASQFEINSDADIKPGAVIGQGNDGTPVQVSVDGKSDAVTAAEKELAEKLRGDNVESLRVAEETRNTETIRNLVKTSIRELIYQNMKDVLNIFVREDTDAKKILVRVQENVDGELIDRTIEVTPSDYAMSQINSAFVMWLMGGGKGKNAQIPTAKYLEMLRNDRSLGASIRIKEAIDADIREAVKDMLPRVKKAYNTWAELQKNSYTEIVVDDIEANKRELERVTNEMNIANAPDKLHYTEKNPDGTDKLDAEGNKIWVHKERIDIKPQKFTKTYLVYNDGVKRVNPLENFIREIGRMTLKEARRQGRNTPRLLSAGLKTHPRTGFHVLVSEDKNMSADQDNAAIPSSDVEVPPLTASGKSSKEKKQIVYRDESDLLDGIFQMMPELLFRLSLREEADVTPENIIDIARKNLPIFKTLMELYRSRYYRDRKDGTTFNLDGDLTKQQALNRLLESGSMEYDEVQNVTSSEDLSLAEQAQANLNEKAADIPKPVEEKVQASHIDEKEEMLLEQADALAKSQITLFQTLTYLIDKWQEKNPLWWRRKEREMFQELIDMVNVPEEFRLGRAEVDGVSRTRIWDTQNASEEKIAKMIQKTNLFKDMQDTLNRVGREDLRHKTDRMLANSELNKLLSGLATKEELQEAHKRVVFSIIEKVNASLSTVGEHVAGLYQVVSSQKQNEPPINAIVLLNNATPETLMHEFMHHLMAKDIMPKQYQDMLRAAYGNDEEAIADAITQYMRSQISDEAMSKNTDIAKAVKWCASVAAIANSSLEDYGTREAKKFFDTFIKEGNVATKEQVLAAKNVLSGVLNSNASNTHVPSNIEPDTAIPENDTTPPEKRPTIVDQYQDEMIQQASIVPVNSIGELLDLINGSNLDGNKPKDGAKAPISVRFRNGKVVSVYINANFMSDEHIAVLMTRLDRAGFNPDAVLLYNKGNTRLKGSQLERATPEVDAAIPEAYFGDYTTLDSVKKYFSALRIKSFSRIKFGSVVSALTNKLKAGLWRAENITDLESDGVLVGFTGGTVKWVEGKRYITVPGGTDVHLVIDPSKLTPKQQKQLTSLHEGLNVKIAVVDADGALMEWNKYIESHPTVNASVKRGSGNIPGVTGQYLGYVDANGHVYMKEKTKISDGHIELFGNIALNSKARFRMDKLTGKVNWLNDPSAFEKEMLKEHVQRTLKMNPNFLDHVGISDGLYFASVKGRINEHASKILGALLKKADGIVKISDLFGDVKEGPISDIGDVTVKREMISPEVGVKYDAETRTITVNIDKSVTHEQEQNLIAHGLSLAHWAEIANDLSDTSLKGEGEFSTAKFNEMGLITSSDYLLDSPKFSAFTEPDPEFKATRKKVDAKWDAAYTRHAKALRILFHFMEEQKGSKLTEAERIAARTMIAREAFGNAYDQRMIDMKAVRKYANAYNILHAMTETILKKMDIDVNDPLEFRVISSLNISSSMKVEKYIKDAVYQLSRYKDVKDLSEGETGTLSIWNSAKNAIARGAAWYAYGTQSIWGIAKFLDHGNPDGVFTRMVRDLIVPGIQKAKEFETRYHNKLLGKLQDQFKNNPELLSSTEQIPWILHKKHEIGARNGKAGRIFTGSELIGIYLATQGGDIKRGSNGEYLNEYTRKIMRATDKLTHAMLEDAKQLVESDPYLKRFEAAISSMFEDAWKPLNETYKKMHNGQEVGRIIGKYFPLMWNFADEEIRMSDKLFDFMSLNNASVKGLDPTAAKGRSSVAVRQTMPAFDAWDVLKVYYSHVDNYVAKANNINMLKQILTSGDISTMAKGKFVNNALLEGFKTMVEREMTLSGRMHKYDVFERNLLAPIRQNIARAILKANPMPVIKQWTSIFPAMTMLPAKTFPMLIGRIMQGYWKALAFTTTDTFRVNKDGRSNAEIAWSGNKEFAEMLRDNPTLRSRVIDINMVSLGKGQVWEGFALDKLNMWERVGNYNRKGPQLLKITDVGVCFAIYKTAKDAEYSRLVDQEGVPHETALRKAKDFAVDVIRQANDPSNYSETSLLQSNGHELIKSGIPFSGFMFKQNQMIVEKILYPAIMAYHNKDGGEFAKAMAGAGSLAKQYRVVLWAMVWPALAMGAMARGRPQKDEDESFIDILTYNFSGLPFLGQYIADKLSGQTSTMYSALWLDTGNSIGDAFGNMFRAGMGKERLNVYQDTKKLAISLSAFKGSAVWPVRFADRIFQYIEGKDVGERDLDIAIYAVWGGTEHTRAKKEEIERLREQNVKSKGRINWEVVPKKDK